MTSSQIKRVLVVGYGSIGKRHLRLVRETLPDAEIMVLRHKPSNEMLEFADFVTASLYEALGFSPQIAVIANPAPFHLETANALVDIGCHILMEKPIASKSTGVKSFIDRVNAANLVCQVGYNLRFLPSLIEFRRLIHSGVIGEPISVRCEVGQYLPDWRPKTNYRNSVTSSRNLGGGVLLELSHEIDYLRWIFGNVRWVTAWIGKLSNLDIDVEDTAFLTIGLESGGNNKEVVASLSMDFVRHDSTRLCTVIGSDGSLQWNGIKGNIEIFSPTAQGWREIFKFPTERDDSYRAQWDHFFSCVKTGNRPLVDGEAGLAVLGVVEGAKRSAHLQSKLHLLYNK